MNDKIIIKKCQKGDNDAFEQLIRLYYPYVTGFLLKSSGDRLLTEDLTQETFVKVIRNIEKFDINGKGSFGTWLITIAKNCYIDYLRKNHLHLDNIDDIHVDSGINVYDQVCKKMQYEEILKFIAKLPPEQGLAIRMKYEEGKTLEEIAKHFGVKPNTIKSRIHEGTMKLRKKSSYDKEERR